MKTKNYVKPTMKGALDKNGNLARITVIKSDSSNRDATDNYALQSLGDFRAFSHGKYLEYFKKTDDADILEAVLMAEMLDPRPDIYGKYDYRFIFDNLSSYCGYCITATVAKSFVAALEDKGVVDFSSAMVKLTAMGFDVEKSILLSNTLAATIEAITKTGE